MECVGKGKASARYEFGVKASIVITNNRQAPGGQFVLHARARFRTTLTTVTGTSLTAPRHLPAVRSSGPVSTRDTRPRRPKNPRRLSVSGQKRGVFGVIKRERRRRSAIEPLIGHLKAEGHLGRCYLQGGPGGATNVMLSAVGHNLRRVLA